MSKQLDQFVRSVIPEPYVIMGCRLQPLSLGHLILMKRFECAFGVDDVNRDGHTMDLLVGVAICCRKYHEFLDWYENTEERDQWIVDWLTAITKEAETNKNWKLMNKFSLFNMYRKEGINVPKFFNENSDDDSRESGAHWIQNLITMLMSETQYTEDELLDMPVAKALSMYYKVLENNGQITFMADWQIEDEERLVKVQKEPVVTHV